MIIYTLQEGQFADIEYPIEPVEILEIGENEQEMGPVNEGEAVPGAENLEEVPHRSPSSSGASSGEKNYLNFEPYVKSVTKIVVVSYKIHG